MSKFIAPKIIFFSFLIYGLIKITPTFGRAQEDEEQEGINSCLLPIIGPQNPDLGLKTNEYITKYGYPVNTITFTTDDGYILTVFRIPYSPQSPVVPGQQKKAVYINHGLGSNSFEWLCIPNKQNIAMMLADAGYDVFLGNARGTSYSQGHTSLTVDDLEYWDFSWHEMGKFDVPTVIYVILLVTGNSRTYYIGHSMGGAEYYVALSEHPELNDKISAAFLMAPAAFIGHSTSFVRLLAPLAENSQYLVGPLTGGRIDSVQSLEKLTGLPLGTLCPPGVIACGLCGSVLFVLFGLDVLQTNFSNIAVAAGAVDTMSTKSLVHFAQSIAHKSFRAFDYVDPAVNIEHYGTPVPPDYNMKASTIPTFIYYGLKDNFVVPIDAERTAMSMAPGVLKEFNKVPWREFNHVDFAIANNAPELVYEPIKQIMDSGIYDVVQCRQNC